ncbi:hypothetical protein VIGAN_08288800 [Vigna angularis var. angularis]|uniref:Uncharacterized protein n=1 Tax=Vigna angularis var. angularis TaxID=157739 RepID=A0A0S3ST99_PHAAN|nr:hypothetical protein VIGAN_08288800 [Vigna angularis var. angularis]
MLGEGVTKSKSQTIVYRFLFNCALQWSGEKSERFFFHCSLSEILRVHIFGRNRLRNTLLALLKADLAAEAPIFNF